jgi:methylthioribulose-1-phosphate dehydratase
MILLASDQDEPEISPDIVEAIVQAGRRMDSRNWVAATAGNISVRLDDARVAITRSGTHKGMLEPEDVIAVDLAGRVLTAWGRASVETPLHCQIYRVLPQVGAVVHGHSVPATVLSLLHDGPALTLTGYEVLKAFGGEGSMDLTVLDNHDVAAAVEPLLPEMRMGYVIRGHGAYAWGPDLETALVRLEALEFLLECELARRRVAPP